MKLNRPRLIPLVLLLVFLISHHGRAAPDASQTFKFAFGSGPAAPGFTQVTPATVYSKERGYGFEPGARVATTEQGCASDQPFFFSATLPEGNYNVKLTLGDAKAEGVTTVKAEQRRLMLENIKTAAGQFEARTITVNVRRPEIPGGGKIRLKSRELAYPNWDEKLTLEFNGKHPAVGAIQITPTNHLPVIYLAGDSTVTDQDKEPWNSWGQMLTRFFKPGIAVANYAESGESLRSFIGEKRLDKVLAVIKKGDTLIIQMGHNDQKDKSPNAIETYKKNLQRFVAEARKRGATPVLVTSMNRRTFDTQGKITNTLKAQTDKVHEVAEEEKVALIDLNAMSKAFYEALGPEESKKAFQDGTHHNNYGSYELAKCVVEGIRQNKLKIAKFIKGDFKGFDPSHPDPVASFAVPASPMSSNAKPEGN